jgi:hypothetical protein
VYLGIEVWRESKVDSPHAMWTLYNPCGVTNVQMDGEKWRDEATSEAEWLGAVMSSTNGVHWQELANIPAPGLGDTWQFWGPLSLPATAAPFVGLRLALVELQASGSSFLEANNATLTLDATRTPTAGVGPEQGNYHLDCTLTNELTGEAIQITFLMGVGESLVVDTEARQVTYDADGRSYFNAVTVLGGPRRHWLALRPATPASPLLKNRLRFDDAGTTWVDIVVAWRQRHYG